LIPNRSLTICARSPVDKEISALSLRKSTLSNEINLKAANIAIDTSQNGLWKMNTDGSGLTRLTTEDSGKTTTFAFAHVNSGIVEVAGWTMM
jgi:hypothetical protein